MIEQFKIYLEAKGYKQRGIEEKLSAVKKFIQYTEEEQIHVAILNYEEAGAYREYLRVATNKDNTLRYTPATINGHLAYLRLFYKYLVSTGTTLLNPFMHIEKMREHTSLPKTILTIEQMKTLLENLPLHDFFDSKFMVILELLYSGGFRISEIENLHRDDINTETGTLILRDDKARRDRIVPLTEYAGKLLSFYLQSAEPEKAYPFKGGKDRSLNKWMNKRLKKYCIELELPYMSCHGIRHTVATHLLKNKAELREVQELLGHSKIRHTERYTHLFPEDLRDVITNSHPRELHNETLSDAV